MLSKQIQFPGCFPILNLFTPACPFDNSNSANTWLAVCMLDDLQYNQMVSCNLYFLSFVCSGLDDSLEDEIEDDLPSNKVICVNSYHSFRPVAKI